MITTKFKGKVKYIALCMVVLLLCFFVGYMGRAGFAIKEKEEKIIKIYTFGELKSHLENKSTEGKLCLQCDIEFGKDDEMINVACSDVTLDLNGHTIYKNNDNALINISADFIEEVNLESDIRIEPMMYPDDFVICVKSTLSMERGQVVFIADKKAGEYNYIEDIIDEKNILLGERPIKEYDSVTGKVYLIEGLKKNISIINGTLEVPYEEYDRNISSSALVKDLIHETNDEEMEFTTCKSIIDISWGMNIKIENIKIFNKNYNLNNIFWGYAEKCVIYSCEIEGGRAGIIFGQYSNNCNLYGNIICDCAPGIWLGGSRNLISANVISGSGATCKEGDGITIDMNGSDNIISQNTILGGNCYGIWGLPGNENGNNITNNVIDSNITYGIYIQSGKNWTITDNRIIRCAGGIGFEDVENSVISGNTIKNNLYCGTIMQNESKNNIIKGNVYSGNNYCDDENVEYGGDIVLFQVDQNCVNIIEDNILEYETKTVQ